MKRFGGLMVACLLGVALVEGVAEWSARRFNYEPAILVAEKMLADEKVSYDQYSTFKEAGCSNYHSGRQFYKHVAKQGLDVVAVRKLCTDVDREEPKFSRRK